MSTVHLQVAPRVGAHHPFGARLASGVFLTAKRALASLPMLFRHAPPRVDSPAEEAQAVRGLARQYQRVDPGFASDLLAAADRHERLHDAA
jgi:hypothetical protein